MNILRKTRRKISRMFRQAPGSAGRTLGFVVNRKRAGFQYGPTFYGGNFKKKEDIRGRAPFGALADEVIRAKTTKLRHDRLFTLFQAIMNVKDLIAEHASVAEVGAFRGGSSYFMASVIRDALEEAPPFHCFDTFEGHPDDIVSGLDGHHERGDLDSTSYETVKAYLAVFPHVTVHQGRIQDTCGAVETERFCLVHIDVDIYTGTRDSLAFFHQHLLPGGIIVLDDYGFKTCPGVKQAAGEFLETHRGYVIFELLTGQAILIRLAS